MTYLALLAGLCLLFLGAELFVRGAVGLARRLGVSPLLVGLTLVGFGTSLPELVASLEAARAGSPGIAVGNVVGSNIANVLLVLGLSAALAPLAVAPGALRRDGPVVIGASLLALAVLLSGRIERWTSLLFLGLLLAYTIHAYLSERRHGGAAARVHLAEAAAVRPLGAGRWAAPGFALGGLCGILLGAGLLVRGAIDLARDLGVSETLVGLTVVAVGTSLPELATSVVAALRRHGDVALGNVLGSNLFNLLGILGATALYRPVPVPAEIARFDAWVMCAAALLLVAFAGTKAQVARWEGALLLAGYLAYLAALALPALRGPPA